MQLILLTNFTSHFVLKRINVSIYTLSHARSINVGKCSWAGIFYGQHWHASYQLWSYVSPIVNKMLFMVQDAQLHTYLEKPWKHLHCVTDLSLCANSKRPAVGVEPRASRYFFFVSRFSNDAKHCSCSQAMVII